MIEYFKRLLKPLSSYVNFTIKAQTLLYSDLNSYKFQQKEKIFYVRSSDLSIITNHLENRLGSRISDSSAFEFVTYVPSKQPLVISSDNSLSRMIDTYIFDVITILYYRFFQKRIRKQTLFWYHVGVVFIFTTLIKTHLNLFELMRVSKYS